MHAGNMGKDAVQLPGDKQLEPAVCRVRTPQLGWNSGNARLSTTLYAWSLRCGVISTPTEKHSRHKSKSGHTAHLMRTVLLISFWQ